MDLYLLLKYSSYANLMLRYGIDTLYEIYTVSTQAQIYIVYSLKGFSMLTLPFCLSRKLYSGSRFKFLYESWI